MSIKPVYYSKYLALDQLLSSQNPVSPDYGKSCHDEMLFIITHQSYELWFKQILHELNAFMVLFAEPKMEESQILVAVHGLKRIVKIQTLFIDYLDILETMTPMDFLEFRKYLVPSSGHQSVQFREVEIKLGLKLADRAGVDSQFFLGGLTPEDQAYLLAVEQQPSVVELVEKWLARMPFTDQLNFDFLQSYRTQVAHFFAQEETCILDNTYLDAQQRQAQQHNLALNRDKFDQLLDQENYEQSPSPGAFGYRATLNALFIFLYRDKPVLANPFQLLTYLMEIDEKFSTWRYRHAIMVQRMLGLKIGTGGSSGSNYLLHSVMTNRVFKDLFQLSTFLMPKDFIPKLPASLQQSLDFYFHAHDANDKGAGAS